MNRTELLAPAGDFSCLTAAINAGADAVYLAGKAFGARAYASNFEEKELIESLDYAHLFSKKIYLTVNTLIKESEFSSIVQYLAPCYEHGLDGIIIQDMGLLPLLKKEFPLLEIHASTQMTINNYRSAKWLKEQGFCRVVPSRELSLSELKEIKEKGGIAVEAFIHGAMCYCYSGQCLFSSFLGGRSGNRGRCAQPCRLPYQVYDGSICVTNNKEVYPLSLKDLCSLPYIYELLDAGIDSFKIEGRMKSPEYTAGVTAVYRKYMDLYAAGKRPAIDKSDLEQLNHLYIRSEMKEGYFKKHNGKDMVSFYSPSYQGCDEQLTAAIHEKYCTSAQKLPITGSLTLGIGNPAVLTLKYLSKSVTVYGDKVQAAQNRPLSKEAVRKQICKTGNSFFLFEELYIEMDDTVFMPVKQLNELRREALTKLKEAIVHPYNRTKIIMEKSTDTLNHDGTEPVSVSETTAEQPSLRISIMDAAQLNALMHSEVKAERIYIPADLFYLQQIQITDVLRRAAHRNIEIYLSMPRIIRKRDEGYLEYISSILDMFPGVSVKNPETLSFLQEEKYSGHIITDTMLYNWNQSALRFLNEYRHEFSYSLELSFYENKLLKDRNGEYVVYGRTPMMVSANCIRRTTDTCKQNSNSFGQTLKDRYGKKLPVFANCVHCYNEIFNAVTMSLHKELPQLIKNHFSKFRLDFTNEDAGQTIQVTEYFIQKMEQEGCGLEFPIREYTSGHFKEGAL